MALNNGKVVGAPVPTVPVKPDHELKKDAGLSAIYDKHYKKPTTVAKENGKMQEVIKEKAKAVRIAKPTIDDMWVRILSEVQGKRYTDVAIAVKVNEACDKIKPKHKKFTEADVPSKRTAYNNGKFPCQRGIRPTTRLEKYVHQSEATAVKS